MAQEDSKHNKTLQFHVARDELFIDMNIYQYGYEKCTPLHQWGPAIRNHFLFHYIISGKGRLDANKGTYYINAKQGFLVCPHEVTTYYADEKDPWEYVWVEFDGLRARECMVLAGLGEEQPVYKSTSKENSVERYMMGLVESSEKSPIRLVGLAMILMDEIIQTSQTKMEKGKKVIRDFYMKEALAFIESNFAKDISIEEIADASGLNRSYFSRLFKETFSVSPQQFLIKYRMTKAGDLLKQSQLSIGQVATSVGYDNQLHFSRAFKNVFGISPSEYRNSHRFTSQTTDIDKLL